MVVSQVKEKLSKKEIKRLDPELSILIKLSDEGLLKPYILIGRADAGIAKWRPWRNRKLLSPEYNFKLLDGKDRSYDWIRHLSVPRKAQKETQRN